MYALSAVPLQYFYLTTPNNEVFEVWYEAAYAPIFFFAQNSSAFDAFLHWESQLMVSLFGQIPYR